MMRSLFSGVAGLKTHQTRMDVIGNNIANVNTTAYKSQSMVFNDLLYQQTQAASGANATTGRGGINPRQIGLGAKTGAISTAITTQGSAQSTNNPWDIMIEGDSFFIVSDGSQNFFTRDGSFTVDGAGNLVMASTGYTVMGWQVDPETGDIRSDVVSALQVMHPDNLTADPEATTLAYMNGILDKTDTSINSTEGVIRTLTFYDAQGYKYQAKFSVHSIGSDDEFRVQLDDIFDDTGMSLVKKYGLSNINEIATFGRTEPLTSTNKASLPNNVTYKDGVFTFTESMSEILNGYSNNRWIVAAGDNVKIIDADIGKTVGPDETQKTVTVEGTITFEPSGSTNPLEQEPYNLLYSVDENGVGAYYKDGKKVVSGTAGTDEITWEDALPDLPEDATVTQDGEKVTITFQVELEAKETATVKTATTFEVELEYDPDDPESEKKVLEQVYNFVDGDGKEYNIEFIAPNGNAQITTTENAPGNMLVFDHDSGKFSYIGSQGSNTATMAFRSSATTLGGTTIDLSQFSDIEIDFSSITNFGNGGKCTLEMTNGSKENSALGSGRKVGALIGIEVGQDGRITASYDNGLTKLLGQIAVAEFANPSGLSKAGNNLYSATMNSGEFDGVGVDITANGGQMTSGVLEMSNVDLSSEFTTMITTQRGFQANSRIITVSDTLLEELVNLKR